MLKSDQELRLYGVYRQDKDEHFMLRVKIPAGFLTSEQATKIAVISKQYSNGMLHLTSRGNVEFHWLRHENLEEIFTALADLGLTTRGACGGAVRGIACSTTNSPRYPVLQAVAQKLNRHFSGNPAFEGLPKKFKIGVDADYREARHLIQDLGLILVNGEKEQVVFDVWCAGGLGREPQAGILLEQAVPETRLIQLIESVVEVYRENTPPPKRLKFLLNTIGEKRFRGLLHEAMLKRLAPEQPEEEAVFLQAEEGVFIEIPVFAGELKADTLLLLARIANDCAGGFLSVTANQDIALLAKSAGEASALQSALSLKGLNKQHSDEPSTFRICPGNHECRMGLAPTRDIARQVISTLDKAAAGRSWAISGCQNSCSQPQLADFGIVTKKLQADEAGGKQPLFDLYHRDDDKLGHCIAEELPANALYEKIRSLK